MAGLRFPADVLVRESPLATVRTAVLA